MIDIDKVYEITFSHYCKARGNVLLEHRAAFENNAALSDVVPGYNAEFVEFGDYLKDNFAVLFIDIRGSTNRAKLIGPENTFLTMHAFIPAMIEVIKHYRGNVIDIMGDGIMAFFGGSRSGLSKAIAVQNAGLCGRDMLKVRESVVNDILKKDNITYGINCGVGVDYGDVIVTKIGVKDTYDVKAFGDCINQASHFSNGYNIVRVSKRIKNQWPTSEGGKISFAGSDEDGYILSRQ